VVVNVSHDRRVNGVKVFTDEQVLNLTTSVIKEGYVATVRGENKIAYINDDGTISFSYDRGNSVINLNVVTSGGASDDNGLIDGFNSLESAINWVNDNQYSNPHVINLPAGNFQINETLTINPGLMVKIKGAPAIPHNQTFTSAVNYITGSNSFLFPTALSGVATNLSISIQQTKFLGAINIGLPGLGLGGDDIYYTILQNKLNAIFSTALVGDAVYVYPFALSFRSIAGIQIDPTSRLIEAGIYVKSSSNWVKSESWIMPLCGAWQAFSATEIGTKSAGGDLRPCYDSYSAGDSGANFKLEYYVHPTTISCIANGANIICDNSTLALEDVVLIGNFANTGVKCISNGVLSFNRHAHFRSFGIGVHCINSSLNCTNAIWQNFITGCNYGIISENGANVQYYGGITGLWKKSVTSGPILPSILAGFSFEGAAIYAANSTINLAPNETFSNNIGIDESSPAISSNFRFAFFSTGGRQSLYLINSDLKSTFLYIASQHWEDGFTLTDIEGEIKSPYINLTGNNAEGTSSIYAVASNLDVTSINLVYAHKIRGINSSINIAFLHSIKAINFSVVCDAGSFQAQALCCDRPLSSIYLSTNCNFSLRQFNFWQPSYNELLIANSSDATLFSGSLSYVPSNPSNTFFLQGGSRIRWFLKNTLANVTSNLGPNGVVGPNGDVVYAP
jgi:hypothetical protein